MHFAKSQPEVKKECSFSAYFAALLGEYKDTQELMLTQTIKDLGGIGSQQQGLHTSQFTMGRSKLVKYIKFWVQG